MKKKRSKENEETADPVAWDGFFCRCKDGHTNKTPPNPTVGSVFQRRPTKRLIYSYTHGTATAMLRSRVLSGWSRVLRL